MEFEVLAQSPADYTKWVDDVKKTASKLTEEEFNTLLDTAVVGRKTYSSTHLEFRPAPEGANGGHHHGGSDADAKNNEGSMDHSNMDMDDMGSMDHSQHE
ncbi:Quinol oxidase subunit 2 precursor [compost metagenome]